MLIAAGLPLSTQPSPPNLSGSSAMLDPENSDFHSVVARSTYLLSGPSKTAGVTAVGTGFVVGMPVQRAPSKTMPVLITAAHVLDGITGDTASITLRSKKEDGSYAPVTRPLLIRKNGVDLFYRHSNQDLAAMVLYPAPPELMTQGVIDHTFILGDEAFEAMKIHPGDEVFVAGFPHGMASTSAYAPIVRGAHISSFPLYPARIVDRMLIDFLVYPGNSGGPVYCAYFGRSIGRRTVHGVVYRGIVGVVIEEFKAPVTGEKLFVSRIVPGQYIIDLLQQLPAFRARSTVQ